MYSESNNLSVVNELLAICDLPLRERDFIEAEKAILGKTATVLYTIIVACCVAIIGAYGMSAQLGLGFLPSKFSLFHFFVYQQHLFTILFFPNGLVSYGIDNTKPQTTSSVILRFSRTILKYGSTI